MHFFYLQGHSQQPSVLNIDRRNLDSFLEPDVGMERGRPESGSAPVKNSGQNCEFHGHESLEEMHVYTDRYEESLQNKENRGQICESDDQESIRWRRWLYIHTYKKKACRVKRTASKTMKLRVR